MELEIRLIEKKYQHLRVVNRGRRARLLCRLEAEGQMRPLLVTESPSRSGWFVLIDGYQRLWALTTLGQETAEVEVLSGSELEGLLLHRSLSVSRPRSSIEDGLLLLELVTNQGLTQEELAGRLGKTQSWVSRKLGLVQELPALVLRKVRSGQIPAYAAERSLLPMVRAKREDCLRLVEALGRKTLSVRQFGSIFLAWKQAFASGDEVRKERVLSKPMLFIKAVEESLRSDHPLPDAGLQEDILKDLRAVGGILRRLSSRFRNASSKDRARLDRRQLTEVFQGVSRLFGPLGELVRKEKEDAGCGETNHHP